MVEPFETGEESRRDGTTSLAGGAMAKSQTSVGGCFGCFFVWFGIYSFALCFLCFFLKKRNETCGFFEGFLVVLHGCRAARRSPPLSKTVDFGGPSTAAKD